MSTSSPSPDQVVAPVHQPARWRLAVLSFIGLYPLVMLSSLAISAWVPWLTLPERTLLVVAAVVPTMTYLVHPLLHRLARPWLRRGRHAVRPPAAQGLSPNKES